MASSRRQGSSRRSWWRRQLSHRRLIGLEALLLVGALENWVGNLVLDQQHWWPLLRVLLSMAIIVGCFGPVLLLADALTRQSLDRSNAFVQALPIPTPLIAVHTAILAGIVWLYAILLRITW